MASAAASAHSPVDWKGPTGLTIDAIRKAIPPHCFVKSGVTSLAWLARDLAVWATAAAIYKYALLPAIAAATEAGAWWAWPLALVGTTVYALVAGTAMWAVFVCGHDAGHGSFSRSSLLNGAAGLLAHSLLLVPFFPWALTHRRHHLKHNHVDDDYSFPWWVSPSAHQSVFAVPWFRVFSPVIGWAAYLSGFSDGNHFVPLGWQRMWRGAPWSEYAKGVLSTACCLVALGAIWIVGAERSLARFAVLYALPWVVFSAWLVTVTYLQHHHEDSHVFTDSSWRYVDAAFETIDRRYGLGLDAFTHHITDCHVVHHLCFSEIPHYHLEDASAALQRFLAAEGKMGLYRSVPTPDFALRVFRYLFAFGFLATLVVAPDSEADRAFAAQIVAAAVVSSSKGLQGSKAKSQ